jgi:phosphoglycolate phosphatase
MSTKPKIKAIIFDLDGTLLNTLEDIAGAMNTSLAELGMPTHLEDDYKGFVGSGLLEMCRRVMPSNKQSSKDIEALGLKFWDHYDQMWFLHTKPYPGVMYLIQLSIARKLKLAILSNKPHYFTKKMIRHFFRGVMIKHFKNPFGVYSGEQKDKPAKPDPTVALELAHKLNVDPANIAFVGDSDVDIKTANNAGMIAVGAAWGFRSKQELIDAGADLVFETPLEFVKYLESSPSI